jgi:hypothetical protein
MPHALLAGHLPWYERGLDGKSTGREWATENEAHVEIGAGCSLHLETAALVGSVSWAPSQWVAYAPKSARGWKPRGWGGTD